MDALTGCRDNQRRPGITRRGALCALGAFAVATLIPRRARAFSATGMIDVEGGRLEYAVRGRGPTVYMIPSFGRGCEDFDALADALVQSGYRVVCAQPRGAGASTSERPTLTLRDMANDAATVLMKVGGAPAVCLGHDFGQRITRTLATEHPQLVKSLIMLACGGRIPMNPQVRRAGQLCFELSLPWEIRKAAVRFAFFAPGNDPTPWKDGWYPQTSRLQGASAAEPVSAYWAGGGVAKALVIQGLQDASAVPENARLFKADFPDRVQLVEVDHAAHALLPEQPRLVAEAALKFLKHHA
ncbi:MAG TPA: alpha/beta hydrolase [Steroidobacteraceae bacterium]|nr:alpha/beta hydrolase [Steroidobacteraceae bacterium]